MIRFMSFRENVRMARTAAGLSINAAAQKVGMKAGHTIESFLLFLRQSEAASTAESEAAAKALEAFMAERKKAAL